MFLIQYIFCKKKAMIDDDFGDDIEDVKVDVATDVEKFSLD